MPKKHNNPGLQVGWTTVTYRSVILAIFAVAAIIAVGFYFVFPEPSHKAISNLANLADRLTNVGSGKSSSNAGPQQASFTLLEGTVRVKKANSNSWVSADYTVPLEKGDVVQTGSEGMARVVFPDGTNYNVKQDSLIVIEENSANDSQQTQVAVQLTTGTVDLSTGTYTQGSRSQVIVAGATASLSRDSSAQVHNDPQQDTHEILLKKGSGEVSRGNEKVQLTDYERVSFKAEALAMTKEKEIAPPTLIAPANMIPIFIAEHSQPVHFMWSPINNSKGYRVRISRNPYFSSTLFDKVIATTDLSLPPMTEGAYYWMVQTIDGRGKESVESEKNRFTVIKKGPENVSLPLEISPFVQHGHVIEVKGKTEANARVMVNGQEVPLVQSDGGFQFFTPPLPNGENVITVTAQNSRGGVRTMQKKVVIQ